MIDLIDQCTGKGPRFKMRPSTISELNRLAVQDMVERPGIWRDVPIEITAATHVPPDPLDVAREIDDMCDYVRDGNGRTSRVISYLVLCAKLGYRLPGTKTIPERIAENKRPYYAALEAADRAWKEDRIDVSAMEALLQAHLETQLADVRIQAISGHRDDVE